MGEMWARMDSRTTAEGEPFFGSGLICNSDDWMLRRHPSKHKTPTRRGERRCDRHATAPPAAKHSFPAAVRSEAQLRNKVKQETEPS